MKLASAKDTSLFYIQNLFYIIFDSVGVGVKVGDLLCLFFSYVLFSNDYIMYFMWIEITWNVGFPINILFYFIFI